jgi:diaminopimelate epimerase
MILQSVLLSGAGNTFHVVDNQSQGLASWQSLGPEQRHRISREVCAQYPGDGFIFLDILGPDKLRWFFYNNDGSDAEMCGNATRCVGYYVKNFLKSPESSWHLSTVAGEIRIEFVQKEKYRITMTAVQILESDKGFFCDTGVPHLVLPVEKIVTDAACKEASRKLRFDPSFQPRGTNVTYVEKTDDVRHIKAVSYERGVEDFTAACGTGAMAAALYNLQKNSVARTLVSMPGGDLEMNLENLNQPTMTGPAVLLGRYEYETN